MKKSRVEKYEDYRKEIEEQFSEDEKSPLENEIQERNMQRSTGTLEDVMAKYDEYTVMIDNASIAEKKILEEKRKKQEIKNRIISYMFYVILGIIALALVVGIICVVINLLK